MAIPKGLAAKARLNMDDGEKVYIEVRQGSPFCHFYTLYALRGRARKPLIARNRNTATNGIEELVEKLVQHFTKHTTRRVLETRIWIYRKRLYRKLLDADPSDLGLARVTRNRSDLQYIPIERLPAGSREPTGSLSRREITAVTSMLHTNRFISNRPSGRFSIHSGDER